MSLRKIRRRLSHTFRFTVDGSLSELAEHLTIDETSNRRYLTISENGELPRENGVRSLSKTGFGLAGRRFSLSHSRILEAGSRTG